MTEENKNDYKIKNFLFFVKSRPILNNIMNNLSINNLFNIIRYNKKLQKRLNKSLNDYQNEYSKIVIEIIPEEGESIIHFSFLFSQESSYHLYINNETEEKKRNYITKYDKAKKVRLVLEYYF